MGVIVGVVVCPSCQQASSGRLRGNISRYFMASVARLIERQQGVSKEGRSWFVIQNIVRPRIIYHTVKLIKKLIYCKDLLLN